MSMLVMSCRVVGVSAVGFGYGSEAHQVATVDIRRASRRRARAVVFGAVRCVGGFMSFVQGVQVCRMCRQGRASFLFFSPFPYPPLFLFSKEKGGSCLQSCKPARCWSFSLCSRACRQSARTLHTACTKCRARVTLLPRSRPSQAVASRTGAPGGCRKGTLGTKHPWRAALAARGATHP